MIKEGIVLYNIELDGCLNGVYTNEHKTMGGIIFNEIAKRKTKKGKDELEGIYHCFYFDYLNPRNDAELEISLTGRMYKFLWKDLKGTNLFKGIGYKMNEKQLAVHYWE